MIQKIIENWAKAQKSGAWMPCPRCGKLSMMDDLYRNAFSRRANIYICDGCGIEESLEDMPMVIGDKKIPLEEWFVIRNIYSQQNIVKSGEKFEINARQTVYLTTQDIDDIMVCALEGGINYWADSADVVEEKRVSEWGHEQIARGGYLLIHDQEEDEVHELNLQKFLTGFKLWVEQGLDHYDAVSNGEVDCCNIDASCADNIVQLALFGQLVYG